MSTRVTDHSELDRPLLILHDRVPVSVGYAIIKPQAFIFGDLEIDFLADIALPDQDIPPGYYRLPVVSSYLSTLAYASNATSFERVIIKTETIDIIDIYPGSHVETVQFVNITTDEFLQIMPENERCNIKAMIEAFILGTITAIQ